MESQIGSQVRSQSETWQARIELGFASRGQKTTMVQCRHYGPLRVQRPFYPEGDVCHVYLLHPPGGVVGGDELDITVSIEQGAHALITTPASAKFYRSNGRVALQQQTLTVKDGAVLEWLPQDTILFSDSYVTMRTRVDLEKSARFIGWEMLCLGRPAGNELYREGVCRQAIELWRDGEPLLIERARYGADSALLNQAWGLQGKTVVATLIATNADQDTLAMARQITLDECEGRLACTLINDVLVCRLLCDQGETARLTFSKIWQEIRPLLLGRDAAVPRIWNT